MSEPLDEKKDLKGTDLDGFAHRVAYQAIDAAEAANPAARYASDLFRDAIISEARSMLGTVIRGDRS